MDIPMDGNLPQDASAETARRATGRWTPGERPLPRGIEKFPVMFDGLAGTYFQVWIVNLLLTIVTIGFYVPFARRRTAQYFYSHTLVADSPLEFTAKPRKMFVGYVLMGLLFVAYQVAAETGQVLMVGFLMFGAAALAPWFWASAMRFRLASTRWRGIRLQFRPRWAEVYFASWPIFVIAAVWLGVFAAAWSVVGELRTWSGAARSLRDVPVWAWPTVAAALLVTLLAVIRLEFNYKRLLFTHALVGDQPGHWKPVFSDFVRVWASTVGVFAVCLLLGVGLAVFAWYWLFSNLLSGIGMLALVVVPVLMLATAALIWMVALLPARAFREARIFRLVWNNVGVSDMARFRCDLRARDYVLLRLRNLLLTFVTLGFYRPFAMISEYRIKAESVDVLVKGGLERVAGRMVAEQGALGDAMADAAGLDLVG